MRHFPARILSLSLLCMFFGLLLTTSAMAVMPAAQVLPDTTRGFISIQMGLALFVTGVCGGYTTFSTFSLDNLFLVYQHPVQMAFNIIASLILATLAAWGGLVIGGAIA